jgi:hypothetical protein
MIKFFRKIRQDLISENRFSRYLIYVLGEVILVVIGILLAISINQRIQNTKDNSLKCEYLNELKFVFDYDIKDVEENILAIETWNPKIEKLIVAHRENKITQLDSVNDKIYTVREYVFFGQRSKTKIEELKYSNLNLIENRELKNRILLYQDSEIEFLRSLERRYNIVDEEIRQYFSKNIFTEDVSLNKLNTDKNFLSILKQKYEANGIMENIYRKLLKEQYEIKKMLQLEIEKNCKENK